ncbi:hypothetical protein ARMGADRAFT_1037943 [Armillaria gallica]|uniref:F-box domain-containing protein n=1 Tax=Armillaria gallica TaxID=47427 RepID=A0A2H3CN90_ARMGA|nr:hypothetical protein ARMGADRAFT_1037943 [Armillaria gallica]
MIIDLACEDNPRWSGEPSRAGDLGLVCKAMLIPSRIRLFETVEVWFHRTDHNVDAVRRWFAHGAHRDFWAYVDCLQVGEADMRVIGSLLAFFPKVNTVRFWCCARWELTTPWSSHFSNISTLELETCDVNSLGLDCALAAFPSLTRIHFFHGGSICLSGDCSRLRLLVCLYALSIGLDDWQVKDFDGNLISPVGWLEECRGLGSLTVTASVGWALQAANKLLEFNSATLTHVDLNTGVLDPLVAGVTKTVLDLDLKKLRMLWIDIHIVSFDERWRVPTRSVELFDDLVGALEAFLSYTPVQDLGFAFHYYGGRKADTTRTYMKRTKCGEDCLGMPIGTLRSMPTIKKMDSASPPQRSRSAIEVLLDNDIMRTIVAEVCDGDPRAANVLCKVSARFLLFGREIAMQSVSVVDCDGEDHTPEVALHWFSHDECRREDRVAARCLEWRADADILRTEMLASVLGLLVNVRSLTVIHAEIQHVPIMLGIENVVLDRCTLNFVYLQMLLDAAPNMQTLGIMGDGTRFVSAAGGDPEEVLALRMPGTLLSLDIDVQPCGDHAERGLSWLSGASALKVLRLGITGRVGCFAGIDLVDANIECLEVLTLALEHRQQRWDVYYDMYRFKVLRELTLSATDADIDLLNLAERLFIGIHVLPPGEADTDIVGITTLAGSGPLTAPSSRTKLACMRIDRAIRRGWHQHVLREVTIKVYFYSDTYDECVAKEYWECFKQVMNLVQLWAGWQVQMVPKLEPANVKGMASGHQSGC